MLQAPEGWHPCNARIEGFETPKTYTLNLLDNWTVQSSSKARCIATTVSQLAMMMSSAAASEGRSLFAPRGVGMRP